MAITILDRNANPLSTISSHQLKNIRFVRYGDLVLLNQVSLKKLGLTVEQLDWEFVISSLRAKFNCTRIAIYLRIADDRFRTPSVRLLGSNRDPWVEHSDNGIRYTFNITKNMFSKGNIKEKLRLSQFDCTDKIVVDLFAGIGYFSLVFAVHCNASKVYCCEWNPAAIEALRKNAILNKVEDRIVVCEGDNQTSAPSGVAHHVNLGLIPTSSASLETACRSLDLNANFPLYLHVHDNVSHFKKQSSDHAIREWIEHLERNISLFLIQIAPESRFSVTGDSVHRIKPYAPHIDHMVVDICIQKLCNW